MLTTNCGSMVMPMGLMPGVCTASVAQQPSSFHYHGAHRMVQHLGHPQDHGEDSLLLRYGDANHARE